jgi:hypothetical protein
MAGIFDFLGSAIGNGSPQGGGLLGSLNSPMQLNQQPTNMGLLGAILKDYGAQRAGQQANNVNDLVQRAQLQQATQSLSQNLFGTPQEQPNTNPIPITPSPIMRTGAELAQLGPDTRNATSQQFNDAQSALNAYQPTSMGYSGGIMSGPQSDTIRRLLTGLPPQMALPLLQSIATNATTPHYEKLGPGESIFNVNQPGAAPIASTPQLPSFSGRPYQAPGPDGTLHQFTLDTKTGKPLDLGPVGPKKEVVNGQVVDLNAAPVGTSILTPPDVLKQKLDEDVARQNALMPGQINLARTTATARAQAQLDAQNSVAPDSPQVQNWAKNVLSGNATIQQVPVALRTAVSNSIANQPTNAYAPIAASRFSTAASRIRAPYMENSNYKLVANGAPFLARINAAMTDPGSVSDQELLDSLTKLNTGQGAVTDAQVKLITDGKSYSDWANTIVNRFKSGGVLSTAQRQQIQELAQRTFANYKKSYDPLYQELTGKLQASGIPEAFWGVPNIDHINAAMLAPSGGAAAPAPSSGWTVRRVP